jgi:anaerobic selenocysteine-containing dehydrogenase
MPETRPANESGGSQTIHRACNLCEAICGLEIRTEAGQIVSIKSDPADPLSQGHICPKAIALKDIHEDPDRLRRPVKRTAGGWQEIGWGEAFDLTVARLLEIRGQHGANSIGAYLGNPSVHNYGSMTHAQHFLGPLKTRNRYSATSVDQLPHNLVAYWMYGHQWLVPIPDIDHTNYLLVLGANPMASNGSLMTVPNFPGRLKALQQRGGKLVVIDPRRSETAAVADEHHFIRPGADAAFLLALLNSVFDQRLTNLRQLTDLVAGLEVVRDAIRAFTPEAVAPVTGIAAEETRRIAREFAAADGGACYGRMGVSTQAFGSLCQWAIQLLNIVTGNLDRRGGTLFTSPAVDVVGAPDSRPGHYAAWHSRVRGAPEFGGELPVATLAEEVLTPGDGQIRALVTIAGNPVLSTPNGRQLDRALASLEFMVAVDFYINETTRHAHVILPPTCAVEHDHFDTFFHVLSVRNTVRYNPAVIAAPPGTLHDWQIYTELGRRLSAKLGLKAMPDVTPAQIIETSLRNGPYGKRIGSLEALQRHPHGMDLGPLQPALPQRLRTSDRLIHCAPPQLLGDVPRAERDLLQRAPGAEPLVLIGRRHLRSNNSWMHNFQRLVKGKPRHQLLMHPLDLAPRGLQDGQRVRVRSRVGQIDVEVRASDDMMRGVVSLPHGWGHDRTGVQLQIAARHSGASINDLTDDLRLDVLSGNAAFNGVPVSVEAGNPD